MAPFTHFISSFSNVDFFNLSDTTWHGMLVKYNFHVNKDKFCLKVSLEMVLHLHIPVYSMKFLR